MLWRPWRKKLEKEIILGKKCLTNTLPRTPPCCHPVTPHSEMLIVDHRGDIAVITFVTYCAIFQCSWIVCNCSILNVGRVSTVGCNQQILYSFYTCCKCIPQDKVCPPPPLSIGGSRSGASCNFHCLCWVKGARGSVRNSVSFPIVSNAIWRLRHTDEGCSNSRKLCKCCQTLSWGIQLQHVYITRIDEFTQYNILVVSLHYLMEGVGLEQLIIWPCENVTCRVVAVTM